MPDLQPLEALTKATTALRESMALVDQALALVKSRYATLDDLVVVIKDCQRRVDTCESFLRDLVPRVLELEGRKAAPHRKQPTRRRRR